MDVVDKEDAAGIPISRRAVFVAAVAGAVGYLKFYPAKSKPEKKPVQTETAPSSYLREAREEPGDEEGVTTVVPPQRSFVDAISEEEEFSPPTTDRLYQGP